MTDARDTNYERVEKRFLEETAQRLRALDPWTRGHFAESLVAEALPGARLAEHSASPHDIEWHVGTQRVTIAVRTSGAFSMDHVIATNKRPFAGSWRFPPKLAWDGEDFRRNTTGEEEKRRCWADVAVLCHHTMLDFRFGWAFYILASADVETWPAQSISPTSLAARGIARVGIESLAESVAATFGRCP